jgi:hypothetical protein
MIGFINDRHCAERDSSVHVRVRERSTFRQTVLSGIE